MRPALQRLLQRPSALHLLELLTGGSGQSSAFRSVSISACPSCGVYKRSTERRFASAAAPVQEDFYEGTEARRPSTEIVSHRAFSAALQPSAAARLSTFDQLLYESDLADLESRGGRLLDDPQRSDSLDILAQLLQFRQRIFGNDGLRNIWTGIRARGLAVPLEGMHADIIWPVLLRLGVQDELLLDEMCRHALESPGPRSAGNAGASSAGFYETVIGHFLRVDPTKAYQWHVQFASSYPAPDGSLARLAETAAFSSTASSAAFGRIYRASTTRNLYGFIVPHLCSWGQYELAYQWHRLLMREGDVPGSSKVVEPLMYHLALYGDQNRLKRLTRRLVDAGVSFTASTSKIFRDNPVISREIMNRILGETFSISPKPFNDAFCARLFATKALSVSLIVTGMQVLGVDAIGPLSTRELAVREGRPETIRERIDQMRAAGISIGSSRFSRLVEKFAVENEAHLLEQLLASDQHPETLEDQQLQESLLASHMAAQNWRKMKTSLIIQTAFSKQPHIERWNLLLRGHLALRRLNAARQTLDEMLVGGIPVSAISCKALLQSVLRPRNPGKRPVSCAPHHQEDDLSTIINMLMGIVQSGRSLPPTSWKEIFLRLGQTGRLDELERLAIWLAAFYSPQTAEAAYARFSPHRTLPRTRLPSATPSVPKTLSPSHPSHPLRQLFPANFHRAVIAWGFLSPPASLSTTTTLTSPSHPSPLTTTSPPWTRGLRLLATLRSYGVAIRTPVLRKAFQQRLLVLFGPGTSSRPANRLARARNAVPMHVMVADARDMWGDDILDGLELPGVDGELTRAVAGGGGAEREEGMIGGEETVEGKGGVDGG